MRLHPTIFLSTRVALQSENQAVQKKLDDHGDNQITEPGSKELTKRLRPVDPNDASPLVTILASCPDPPITQKLLLWGKNTHFHPNLWSE
jgi:hypothetical protein